MRTKIYPFSHGIALRFVASQAQQRKRTSSNKIITLSQLVCQRFATEECVRALEPRFSVTLQITFCSFKERFLVVQVRNEVTKVLQI